MSQASTASEQKKNEEPPQKEDGRPEQPSIVEIKPIQGLCRQILFSTSIGLGMFLMGFALAYTAPALVSMAEPESTLHLSKFEEMWMAGLLPLAALVGCLIAGPIIDLLGRRLSTFFIGPSYAAAWLLIFLAVNAIMLYVGRIIAGLCIGVSCVCMAVYMGEVIQPELRGILGLIPSTVGNVGILACYVIGKYLEWRYLALLGAIITGPYMVLALVVPESPFWYLYKGKPEKAQESLRWLRGGNDADIYEELVSREVAVAEMKRTQLKEKKKFKLIFKRRHRLPVGIAVFLNMSTQLTGITALIFYSVNIFKDAGSNIGEYECAIIVGTVKVVAAIGANIFIDRLGRRLLLIISCNGTCVTLALLGLYFFIQDETDFDETQVDWMPLVCFILYVIAYSIGLGPIPWLMLGEILPGDIRSTAAAIATALSWLCAFLVAWLFPLVVLHWGNYIAFWIFAVMALGSTIFVIFVVPETRKRTLEDIQRQLEGLPPPLRESLPPSQPSQDREGRSLKQSFLEWSANAPPRLTPTGTT